MSNSYDEIKKLLESSRAMRGDDTLLNEVRSTLKKSGLLTEQGTEGYETANNSMGSPRPNLAADTDCRNNIFLLTMCNMNCHL